MLCKTQLAKSLAESNDTRVKKCIKSAGVKTQHIMTPHSAKRKISAGEASHFRIQGQPWESKDYAILNVSEINRIRHLRPLTHAEAEEEENRFREEQRFKLNETERWRNYFKDMDDERKEHEAQLVEADKFTEEEKEKRAAVLKKALIAKHEQDDIVRKAVSAIGEAKCSAMWTQQVNERKLKDEMTYEHDVRLQQKNQAYQQSKEDLEKQAEEQKQMQREKFAEGVRSQIKNRQRMRFIEEERVRVEHQMLNELTEALKLEKEREQQEKRKLKETYRNDLRENIQLSSDFKRMMCEQDVEIDRRNIKFVELVQQRNAKLKTEKEHKTKEHSRKQDKLFEIQQKRLDAEVNYEAMRFVAEREKLDRKYRENEHKLTLKRLRDIEKIRKDHTHQIAQQNYAKECFLTQREREIREKFELAHIEEAKLQVEAEQVKCKKLLLRRAIGNQINSKEQKRRNEVKINLLEAENTRASEENRKREVEEVIQVKVNELHKTKCLPDDQLNSLQTRLALLQHKK